MIQVARENSLSAGVGDHVHFQKGDVTNLNEIRSATYQLVTFTGAAHHLPDLAAVARTVAEMDRIASSDGLVMVMDLVRLRTAKLTEDYVRVLGHDYVERNLPAFLDDFRNSMYAVWTPREFESVIPRTSDRWWCHIVPYGLPTLQILLGLPAGRKRVFVNRGFSSRGNPVIREWHCRWKQLVDPNWADETLKEWKILRATLGLGSRRRYPPSRI
jgi:SAM-dependent methyltransferase